MAGGVPVTALNYADGGIEGGTVPIMATARAMGSLRMGGLDVAQSFPMEGEQAAQTITGECGTITKTDLIDLTVTAFARNTRSIRYNTYAYAETTANSGSLSTLTLPDSELFGYQGSQYANSPNSSAYGLSPVSSYNTELLHSLMANHYSRIVAYANDLKIQKMYDTITVQSNASAIAGASTTTKTYIQDVPQAGAQIWSTNLNPATATSTIPERGWAAASELTALAGNPTTFSPSYNNRISTLFCPFEIGQPMALALSGASQNTYRQGVQFSDGSFSSPNQYSWTNNGINASMNAITNFYTNATTGDIIGMMINNDCFIFKTPILSMDFFQSIAPINSIIPGFTQLGASPTAERLDALVGSNSMLMGSTSTQVDVNSLQNRYADRMVEAIRMRTNSQYLDANRTLQAIDPRCVRIYATRQQMGTGIDSLGVAIFLRMAVNTLRVQPSMIEQVNFPQALFYSGTTYSNPLTGTLLTIKTFCDGILSMVDDKPVVKLQDSKKDHLCRLLFERKEETKSDIEAAKSGLHKYYYGKIGGNPHTNYNTLDTALRSALGVNYENEIFPGKIIKSRNTAMDYQSHKSSKATNVEQTGSTQSSDSDLENL